MAASAKTLATAKCLDGDWTVVLPRRGRQRKHLPRIRSVEQQQSWAPTDLETDPIRTSKLMQKMQICIKKIESSPFYHILLDQIQTTEIVCCLHRVLGSELKMQMVIYGIGSIESYEAPRLQLSLAILMKKKLSWIGDIEVFDPILSATESRVLEALGCSVLSVNEQGHRCALKPTIFFMPHCEAELYDNLLHANWGVELLNRVVLFGNSFETYEQHVSEFKHSAIVDSVRHILAIRPFTKEFKIKTVSDDYFGAFHDSSWHFFSPVLETGLQFIKI
ncbi:protein SENSITIVITY TO RED LIGHT REDUCED 1-like [Juglans microcarpa x Juglans regia]|uniref:protein SENSITIVITY TO RED LIGHT REDUCED 1-like n=1 Tax=Juglans microcarpa x Juglans regia TaxID=2249226 RepID=UPI001B7EAB2A|nr:protein SENSITIVITY TO RED LIGHT REDUCED 1-like [Juglans microcarpa x Juglans regia]